jgi:energy-coupling factor transporter ATP-binding protein EcfA2
MGGSVLSQAVEKLFKDNSKQDKVANSITDRLSQELIIALVGPVASGVSTTARYLSELLTQKYGYVVCPTIKPSAIIKTEAVRVGVSLSTTSPLGQYITEMQDVGNKLREKFGGDYLAEKAVEKIVRFRKEKGGYQGEIPLPGRRAYIIDSIKIQKN